MDGTTRLGRLSRALRCADLLSAELIHASDRLSAAISRNEQYQRILEAGIANEFNEQAAAAAARRDAAQYAPRVRCASVFDIAAEQALDCAGGHQSSTFNRGLSADDSVGGAGATVAEFRESLPLSDLHLPGGHFAQIAAPNAPFAMSVSSMSTKKPVGSKGPKMWFAVPFELIRSPQIEVEPGSADKSGSVSAKPAAMKGTTMLPISEHSYVVAPGLLAPNTYAQRQALAAKMSASASPSSSVAVSARDRSTASSGAPSQSDSTAVSAERAIPYRPSAGDRSSVSPVEPHAPRRPAMALDMDQEVAWSAKHIKILRSAVLLQAQRHLMRKVHLRAQQAFRDPVSTTRRGLEQELASLRSMPDDELARAVPPDGGDIVDWNAVAAEFSHAQTGNNTGDSGSFSSSAASSLTYSGGAQAMKHTADECLRRWMHFESPRIDRSAFSAAEDALILRCANRSCGRDWERMANDMRRERAVAGLDANIPGQSERTPYSVFARFQKSLNFDLVKRGWSVEDDKKLVELVELYGEDWLQVSAALDGRTQQQCLTRWKGSLNPEIRKGRWTVDEDEKLAIAVSAYSLPEDLTQMNPPPRRNRSHKRAERGEATTNVAWNEVANHVPGRTDAQCRERWCNVLQMRITSPSSGIAQPSAQSHEDWTHEERAAVAFVIEKIGVGKWSQAAQTLRSGVQVLSQKADATTNLVRMPNITDNLIWRFFKQTADKKQLELHRNRAARKRTLRATKPEEQSGALAGTDDTGLELRLPNLVSSSRKIPKAPSGRPRGRPRKIPKTAQSSLHAAPKVSGETQVVPGLSGDIIITDLIRPDEAQS